VFGRVVLVIVDLVSVVVFRNISISICIDCPIISSSSKRTLLLCSMKGVNSCLGVPYLCGCGLTQVW